MNTKESRPEFRTSPPPPGTLRTIPLGGLGEFGKNSMIIEYEEDMILLDCGQKMPEADMFGVDLVIPDFSYLFENLERLRAVVLTHGHEDHIGGIPYLLRQLPGRCVPIYGSRLTLALVRHKVREEEIEDRCDLIEVHEEIPVDIGVFQLDFVPVSHSIPMSMAIFIRTPIGTLLHTGDYKLDTHPDGECPTLAGLRRHAERDGVLLLMADSTNVDRKGHSPTEDYVREGLDGVFEKTDGTIILATFSSSLSRVQTVLDLALKHGRKVAVCGFSLERNFGIAAELGLLKYPEQLTRTISELNQVPPGDRLIITTGSQGEPNAALSRMATNTFKGYRVKVGDTIILSSRMIPGNERGIYRMINNFYRHGARVVTERDAPVHASGHACRGEMQQLLEAVKPRFLMPVHGELRQQVLHRDLGLEMGIPWENIPILENGEHALIDAKRCRLERSAWSGQVMVDGKLLEGVHEVVLRDRRYLSGDGMLTAIIVIDKASHKIVGGPDIVSRGFVMMDDNEQLINECKQIVVRAFEDCNPEEQEDWEIVKLEVRRALRKYIGFRMERYPVILPVVVEI